MEVYLANGIPEIDWNQYDAQNQPASKIPDIDFAKLDAINAAQDQGKRSGYTAFMNSLISPIADTSHALYHVPGEIYKDPKGAINAIASGLTSGAEASGQVALAKGISKLGSALGFNPMSPEQLQKSYEQDLTNTALASQQNPGSANLGNLVGQVGGQAPLFLLGPEAGIIENAAAGLAAGFMQTSPGQRGNIFNPYNALTGGAIGSAVGIGGNFLTNTKALQTAQDIMKAKGYNGPILSNQVDDILKNAGSNVKTSGDLLYKTRQTLANYAANDVAKDVYQNEQLPEVTAALSAYFQKLMGGSTKPQALDTIQGSLQAQIAKFGKQEDAMWDAYRSTVPDTIMQRSNSLPILKEMVADPNMTLTTAQRRLLSESVSDLTPSDMITLRNDVYKNITTKLEKKKTFGTSITAEDNTLDASKALYDAINQDLELHAIKNGGEAGIQAFNAANSYSRNYRSMFDAKTYPTLHNVVVDKAQDMQGVQKLASWLQSSNTPVQALNNAGQIVGKKGMAAVVGSQLDDALSSSLTTVNGKTMLNADSLLSNLANLQKTSQGVISQPAIEAMTGLIKFVKDSQQQIMARSTSPMLQHVAQLMNWGLVGLLGGVATGHVGVGAALGSAIALISPKILGHIALSSPIKSGLITLNRAGANSALKNYIGQQVGNNLVKAYLKGVQMGPKQEVPQ